MSLLIAAPAAALGQAAPGIDLGEPAKPEERKAEPRREPPRPAPAGPAEGVLGPALGVPGDRDAALGDRVKAVPRRGFLKRHRLEITAGLPVSVNDAFYQKAGVSGRLAYNVQESFALALRGAYWWTLRTDHVREGQVAFQSQVLSSRPIGQLMLDAVLSPVAGKASVLGSRIVHFDVFLLGGAGVVWSDTSLAPRSEGPHPAADLGAGIRFYPYDWMALELGFTATLYPDRPARTAPGTTTRLLAAGAGVSVFWPFGFEYSAP
ncbi:MAG TPA: outer membrane beta-barrel domain-containing protein [Anaeromyxobacteraceae bacterium]